MKIGRYRYRLTFQKPGTGRDKLGQSEDAWVDVCTVWGYVKHLRGRELMAAQQAQSEVTVEIGVRYMRGITTNITSDMRVSHAGTIYGIEAVMTDEAQREIIALCKAVG